MKTSNKLNAQYLAQLLKQYDCRRIVIAPGSRNAPLIIAFSNDPEYSCYSVPDERVAAFTAMGMSLEHREPVAVVCSSGSAAVNFYPAVVEAFYQQLPLIVITADRPKELIDQGVGQTIRQEDVFQSHILKAASLLRDPKDKLERSYNQRLIHEAMLSSAKGPVHLNIPFDEPLYETDDRFYEELNRSFLTPVKQTPDLSYFKEVWKSSDKVLVLAGFMDSSEKLAEAVNRLNAKSPFLVLSETVSNLQSNYNIRCIDRLINTITAEEKEELRPDLLISMGGEVVSKMVKQFLEEFPPKQHWHISSEAEYRDTFQFLNAVISSSETAFFEELEKQVEPDASKSSYRDYWMKRAQARDQLTRDFSENVEFSDLKAFYRIVQLLPPNSILHTANSASIRYSQLFDHHPSILHYTNRGTSGIDGCTSTAIGHALVTSKPVTLVTGDVAFLYDSNAFWNDQLPANLRVIVLNNSGGNIFRIIKGPEKNKSFERFQETTHKLDLAAVAALYKLEFNSVDNDRDLRQILPAFFNERSEAPRILEIRTPRLRNPEVLQEYFQSLRNA